MTENRYDLTRAHRFSACNREELERSELCGCFCCCKIYSPSEISQWIKERNRDGSPCPDTAICPRCGVDSVISERDDLRITPKFLMDMHKRWFEERKPEFDHDVLAKADADALRKCFTDKFTDKSLPYYNNVLGMGEHFDGICYSGYIWEVIKEPRVVRRTEALALLKTKGDVCVMWDIRTMENVGEEYRYKVPKDMMIKASSDALAKQLEYDFGNSSDASFIPGECYVFDESLEWYIAFTTEFHPKFRDSLMCLTNISAK